MIGETIGNYRLTAKLGEGGMGQVFLAEHPRIARRVAIKVLHRELSGDRRLVERLFDEALATNLVKHPGIVQVFDCGFEGDRAYLIMELLEGQSLAALLRAGRLAPAQACALGAQIAAALGAAHDHQIVHRDLKPDNIFLLSSGAETVVKIVDFGIAKLTARPSPSQTDSAMLLGTPAYMSPEQCAGGRAIDARTDLYTLGGILFEMVTGRLPFQHTGWGEYIAAHQTEEPPSPASLRPELDPALDQLILQMLAKRPQDRPSSMHEVQRRLEAIGGVSPLPDRRTTPSSSALEGAGTTLGSGTPQRTPITRPGAGRRWGLGIVVVGVLAVGGLAVRQGLLVPAPAPQVAAPSALVPPPGPPEPPAPPPLTTVEVRGAPPETRVWVDGQPAQLPLALTPGAPHAVVFRAPGYQELTVSIDPRTTTGLDLEMTPVSPPPRAEGRRRAEKRERPTHKSAPSPPPAPHADRFRGFEDL